MTETASVDAVVASLVATEYSRLPRPVRDMLAIEPTFSLAVRQRAARVHRESLDELPALAPATLVPKLGIKTWRDAGSLRLIHEGLVLAERIDALLAAPTRQQRITLAAWRATHCTAQLYLLPYRDMADTSEARFLCGRGGISLRRGCGRGASLEVLRDSLPRASALAAEVYGEMNMERCIVDTAIEADGTVWLLEVNPVVTPAQVEALANLADQQAEDDGVYATPI